MKFPRSLSKFGIALFAVTSTFLASAQVRIVAERDTPSAGQDFFLLSYPSISDLVNGTGLTQIALPLPLVSGFSIGGFLEDAGAFRFIAERDEPSAGSDLFMISYPSFSDMLSGTGLSQIALPLPLSSTFSIGGFLEDAGTFRFIAERDVPSAGSDLFMISYPSFTDMLNGTGLSQIALPLPLSSTFSVGGFLEDAGAFRFIAERDVPSAGSDLFMISYPSFSDMLNGTGLSQIALPLPLSSTFSVGGALLEVPETPSAGGPGNTPTTSAVPDCGSTGMLMVALAGLIVMSRRNKRRS